MGWPNPMITDETLKAIMKLAEKRSVADTARTIQMEACEWAIVAFAVGGLLLLIATFWPVAGVLTLRGWRNSRARQSRAESIHGMERSHLAAVGLGLMLLVCAVGEQLKIDRNRGFISDQVRKTERILLEAERRGGHLRDEMVQTHYMYLPEKEALPYLFLGNTSVAADYMWLTSLQYVASPFRRGKKFELMYRFYDTILYLDPHWVDIHVNAGKVLSALDPDRFRTDRFMRRAMVENPEDYRIAHQAGRLWVVPPLDPRQLKEYSSKASAYFEMTLQPRKRLPKSARPGIIDMLARFKTEAGMYREARVDFWKSSNNLKNPEKLREHSSRKWLHPESLVRADIFKKLVDFYRSQHATWPASLTQALQFAVQKTGQVKPSWLAQGLRPDHPRPLDAYGYPLSYQPETGTVSSLGEQYLRSIQIAKTLEGLCHTFRAEPKTQRFPNNMQELTQYLKFIFRPPNDPPFQVREAIGLDLDCTRSPFGQPWDYDRNTGRITLPPDCRIDLLYRNSEFAMNGQVPPYFEAEP